MRLEAEQNDDMGRLLPLDAMLFVLSKLPLVDRLVTDLTACFNEPEELCA